MGRPAGIRGVGSWRGGEDIKVVAACLVPDRGACVVETAANAGAAAAWSGEWERSCNPVLIALDLLNRSSRFKSQQITPKEQRPGPQLT